MIPTQNHSVINLSPVTRGMVEDRSIQKPGDADALVNWTLDDNNERIRNRPGVRTARCLKLSSHGAINTDESARMAWDDPLLDASLHIWHGKCGTYAVGHGAFGIEVGDLGRVQKKTYDVVVYDAKHMQNSGRMIDGKLHTAQWLYGNQINATTEPTRASSVEFNKELILFYPGLRAWRVIDRNAVRTPANPFGMTSDYLGMIDRTNTPAYAATDDSGPYDIAKEALDSPVRSGFGVSHGERLFVAGNPEEPSRVWYSNVLDAEGWPASNTFTVTSATGDITGLASSGAFLYVFTELSVYVVTNAGQPNETLIEVTKGVGCIAHGSIQSTGSGVIFLGSNGHVYMVSGNKVRSISEGRVQRKIVRDQCARGRITSLYQSSQRRYLLMFADHGSKSEVSDNNPDGFKIPSLTNPDRNVGNRWYEYRVGKDAWFPWEFRIQDIKFYPEAIPESTRGDPGGLVKTAAADPRKRRGRPVYKDGKLVKMPTELLDAKVIRDSNGHEWIHGIRRNAHNRREVVRVFFDNISDEGSEVYCGWISSPISMYGTVSIRPRRAWVITEEVSNKSMTVDMVTDDDRLHQETAVELIDRSRRWVGEIGANNWKYGVVKVWEDQKDLGGQIVRYRGGKPLKRTVGIRDGERDVGVKVPDERPTYPATGKHFSVWLEVACTEYDGANPFGSPTGDQTHNLGNAYLYGAQVEVLPKGRRSE